VVKKIHTFITIVKASKMKVSVIGLGKLGLCTAVCCARAGLETWGMDIRQDHLALLEQGRMPFDETDLEWTFQEGRPCLHLTADVGTAVANTDISLIIVPTPSMENGAFSNEHVLAALESMAPALRDKDAFHVVAVVSTVMPGTCEQEFIPLLERATGKVVGRDFGLAYNPEFIAIGSVIHDFLNPDLVLIGASDQRSANMLQAMYAQVCDNGPHMGHTSLINAEIAKLCINCYCTMKISFANNLSALCERTPGADAGQVVGIIGHDSRIGPKYIRPGLGFGGPCFPRDNEAFIRFARNLGGFGGLQEAVVAVNGQQVERLVRRILKASRSAGNKVALLGLSYKPGTYLTERSQALEIAVTLGNEYPELELRVYDPMARETGPFTQTPSLERCVENANVAAILTPWPEFMNISQWKHLLADQAVMINPWAQSL
jgi:UDPglucose 6-dehydrogenase